jgi:hypothetical protein
METNESVTVCLVLSNNILGSGIELLVSLNTSSDNTTEGTYNHVEGVGGGGEG